MQFSIYLVDNGIITCEECFESLKLHLRSRPQLGALAIQMRKLDFRQVFAILRAQCDAPNELFGELAVSLGYLTQDDLSQLLAEQSLRSRSLVEILIENGMITADEADRYFNDYRSCMKQAERDELAAAAPAGELAFAR